MVFHSLKNRINRVNTSKSDFYLLLTAYKQIIHDELSPENIEWKPSTNSDIHSIICNKCNGDIFNRFYNCIECEDVDICFSCILKGRECNHSLQLIECVPWCQLKKLEEDADILLNHLCEGSSPEFRTISEMSLCEAAIQAYQKKRPPTKRARLLPENTVDSIEVDPASISYKQPLEDFTFLKPELIPPVNPEYYSKVKIPQNHRVNTKRKNPIPRKPGSSKEIPCEVHCKRQRRFPEQPTEEIPCQEDIK